MNRILITGATGNFGRAALDHLDAAAQDIHVLCRRESDVAGFAARGITAHVGDYDDPRSLDEALDGIDCLLFVSSPVLDPATRSAQHRRVVDAAVAARLANVVYTSARGAEHDPGHSATESALANSGLRHTVLRNALYTEPFVSAAVHDGVVRDASAGGAIASASIRDLAEAAVRALLAPPSRIVWELRGAEWTFEELANEVHLARVEVPDEQTGAFAALFPLVRRGVFAATTPDLEELLGHAPRALSDVVADVRAS